MTNIRQHIAPIGSTLLTLALGIVLTALPNTTVDVVSFVLGGLYVLYAILSLAEYLARRTHHALVRTVYYSVVGTVIMIVVPMVMSARIFGFLVGGIYAMRALSSVSRLNIYRKAGVSLWWTGIITATLRLSLALLMILIQDKHVISLCGIALMVDSVVYILHYLLITVKLPRLFGMVNTGGNNAN